ncbi:hypothetical protein EBS80_02135 [bacterium]|nr:hypothetical protein [bacterium]
MKDERLETEPIFLTVRLLNTVGTQIAFPDDAWKTDSYLQSHPEEARMYEQLGKAGEWRCQPGGNIYDASVPEELDEHVFDIPLLAAEAGITRPWHVLRNLEAHGWVSSDAVGKMTKISTRAAIELAP